MTQSFRPVYCPVTLGRKARIVIRGGVSETGGDTTLWGGGVRG